VITPGQRIARSILAVMAGSLAITSLAGQAPFPAFEADVPLLESGGLPCVEARIGTGPAMLFGIDTGNMNTCIDAKVAKASGIGLSALPSPAPAGFSRGVVPELHVGAVTFEGRHALVFDFAANQMPAHIAGTLAYTMFKDRILQIDFAARRVRISGILTGPAELPEPRDSFSLVTFGQQGPPIVVARGFDLGGRPVAAQLDTMYTGSMLIYSASIGSLGLDSLAKTGSTEFFANTDGGVAMRVAAAPPESFHGIRLGPAGPKVYFPTPGVHEPDGLFEATVGLALFQDAVLTLDFHGNTISVSKPVATAPIDGSNVPRDRIPRDLVQMVQ
jgi:hypothetical protein